MIGGGYPNKRQSNTKVNLGLLKKPRLDSLSTNQTNQQTTTRTDASTTSNKPKEQQKANELITIDDSDDDLDEIISLATQVEKEEIAKQATDTFSYTAFAPATKSTQFLLKPATNFVQPSTSSRPQNLDSQKENNNQDIGPTVNQYKTLQNRCKALERQLERLKEDKTQLQQKPSQLILPTQSQHQSNELKQLQELASNLKKENAQLKLQAQQPNVDQRELDMLREQLRKKNEIERANLELRSILVKQRSNNIASQQQEEDVESLWKNMARLKPFESERYNARLPFPQCLGEIEMRKNVRLDLDLMLLDLRNIYSQFSSLSQEEKENSSTCFAIFIHIFEYIRIICQDIEDKLSVLERPLIQQILFTFQHQMIISETFKFNQEIPKPENYYQDLGAQDLEEFDTELHLSKKQLFPGEEVTLRLVMVYIAKIVGESKYLSQLVVTNQQRNINVDDPNLEQRPNLTILELITYTVRNSVVMSRLFLKYQGFALALGLLACNIGRHYSHFKDEKVVDRALKSFLNCLLHLAVSCADVLIPLTEFIIIIAQTISPHRLFTKLCTNYSATLYTEMPTYRMLQIPNDACEFQILFMLIFNAFVLKEVPQWRLETLFKLTENLNAICFEFLSRGPRMKCLQSNFEFNNSDQCKCLYGLVMAVVTINRKLLEQRHVYFKKYAGRFKGVMKSYMRTATLILCYIRSSWSFTYIKFIPVSMNLLYLVFQYGQYFSKEELRANNQLICYEDKKHTQRDNNKRKLMADVDNEWFQTNKI